VGVGCGNGVRGRDKIPMSTMLWVCEKPDEVMGGCWTSVFLICS